MNRVVITGMGIWSSIGQNLQSVTESLRLGNSGIIYDSKRVELGLQSGLVGNVPRPNLKALLPRKFRTTMSLDSEYAYMAVKEAFEQAKMSEDYLYDNEVGIIFGNDGNTEGIAKAEQIKQERDTWMLDPSSFFKGVTSSVTMNIATIFHLRGINICIGAGCASASHAIGIATMLIRNGLQKTIIVGGSSETEPNGTAPFDALGILSHRDSQPTAASRPFDKNRDGGVISGGAAALVLEDYEHAVARGAVILAEVVGYGFSCNEIEDIYQADSNGIFFAMERAMRDANLSLNDIDYINSCASSSITDDKAEAQALTRLCKGHSIPISSTQSMTGHEGWMGGASEAIYCTLMMQNGFIAPTINVDELDECARSLNIVRTTQYENIRTVMSTSSGLGGTNSCLILTVKI
jgi:3-oxoacyl-[acyl-carrier-protein] synthase-1